MPCRNINYAFRREGSADQPKVIGQKKPENLPLGTELLELPCQQCTSCRLEKSRIWGARIAHEAAYLEEEYSLYSTFITLTYNEKWIPAYGSLVPEHLQKFIKRLRRDIAPRKIRYYGSGEYGSQCPKHEIKECPQCGPVQRPHYHAIILGYDFPDRVYVGEREGLPVYYSEQLEKLWSDPKTGDSYGFHEIGSCSFQSAAYCARYVMKKQTGKNAEEHYTRLCPYTGNWYEVNPEFAHMSTKPGIGMDWFEKYKSDIYPIDQCPVPGRMANCRPPRYYDKLFGDIDNDKLEEVKQNRREKMLLSLQTGPPLESRFKNEDARLKLLGRKL